MFRTYMADDHNQRPDERQADVERNEEANRGKDDLATGVLKAGLTPLVVLIVVVIWHVARRVQ